MNNTVSVLTDNRLKALDESGADRELLKSLNSDLLWIKKELRNIAIGNSDVVLASMLSRLMDNDCSEALVFTEVPKKTVTVNRNGKVTTEKVA